MCVVLLTEAIKVGTVKNSLVIIVDFGFNCQFAVPPVKSPVFVAGVGVVQGVCH